MADSRFARGTRGPRELRTYDKNGVCGESNE
jgi:hypothetical protein